MLAPLFPVDFLRWIPDGKRRTLIRIRAERQTLCT